MSFIVINDTENPVTTMAPLLCRHAQLVFGEALDRCRVALTGVKLSPR